MGDENERAKSRVMRQQKGYRNRERERERGREMRTQEDQGGGGKKREKSEIGHERERKKQDVFVESGSERTISRGADNLCAQLGGGGRQPVN